MTKKDYVQKLDAQLDKWKADIDKLKAEADSAGAEMRGEYRKQIDRLQKKRKEAEERIAEVRQAGAGAWEDLKAGVQRSRDSMDDALKTARSRLNALSNKETYVKEKNAQLKQLSAELARLQTKAKELKVDASIKLENSLEPLRGKLDELQGKIAELAETSDHAWDHFKIGFEKAWGELRGAMAKARSEFK
jgi:chromosome segregation ATPase